MRRKSVELIPGLKLRIPNVFTKLPLIGAKPGTLNITPGAPPPRVRVIQYSATHHEARTMADIGELERLSLDDCVTWVDVQGMGDEPSLRRIAGIFDIDDLTLEDMVNVPQRPKITRHGKRLLWVTRMVRFDADGMVDREQVSMLHNDRLLVTFQERTGDVFDPIRERLQAGTGRIRQSGADYLAYALIDTVIDGYYPVVAQIGETMDRLEALIMDNPQPDHLAAINQTRVLLSTLRRGFVAQERALRGWLQRPPTLVAEDYIPYFEDCLDHTQQLNSVMENQREQVAGLLNTYLSMVSYRANEVMKVLTIMASIFIPLTFIAGIYGMNFENMPELSKPWAYPAALLVMGTVAGGMVMFFVRKGWIGESRRRFKGVQARQPAVSAAESIAEGLEGLDPPEPQNAPAGPVANEKAS